MSRILLIALDCFLGAVLIATLLIVVTGGGVFVLAGHTVRAHSIGNALVFLYVFGGCRIYLADRVPFFGRREWSRRQILQRSETIVDWVRLLLETLAPTTVWRVCWMIVAASLLAKLGNAHFHFGFFSGDDVEIQEMTFARLFHWDWTAWSLRSAFYPMTFIYPVQALLLRFGVSSPQSLVFAGRAVVAIGSSLGLVVVFLTTRRLHGSATAVLATAFCGMSGLVLALGGTELPRPLSAVFVVLGFAWLARGSGGFAIVAGAAVGIAAAMRFSEALFVIPATLQLLIERRWRHTVAFGAAFIGVAAGIQASADYLYWGEPFKSAMSAFDYTILNKLSSRGYQPVWHYATQMSTWSDLFVVGLACYATARGFWREALWAWTPLILLSLLPHKEARYLIPIIPFISMLAAAGLWTILGKMRADSVIPRNARAVLAIVLIAGFLGSALYQLSTSHFAKSEDDVRLARRIASSGQVDVLAGEQVWRLGGRLYLGSARDVVNLELADFSDARALDRALSGKPVTVIAVLRTTCRTARCEPTLSSRGFSLNTLADSSYVVFSKPRTELSR